MSRDSAKPDLFNAHGIGSAKNGADIIEAAEIVQNDNERKLGRVSRKIAARDWVTG